MFPYVLMAMVTVAACVGALPLRARPRAAARIGFACWISLSVYFVIESIVILRVTAPYSLLYQPMSDLGVTICGIDTYPLALYEICSPSHLLMNWTFTLTGVVIAVGAILLHQFWPRGLQATFATVLLVIYGLSYAISGIVPANIGFAWHTLGALPGMVAQIPALLLIALTVRGRMPQFAAWTSVCLLITTGMLLLLALQPVVPGLPGGLLQRLLYGSVYLWMVGTAIFLWKTGVRNQLVTTDR